ncbi:hypothetical protein BDZ85DRAFT_261996 [Elsinoe ampelina]|uniref:Uncharacterized protein n=1 Tax=Elsinoe ampelina TaxID=302913 RepID=A0A6A6GDH6_9PEZI|nr:hypothetical protein BDZ85DRAFT_261996 [Elsinoe ampelina]
MSSGKDNGTTQRRPLRNQPSSGRLTASPLTPRLAPNGNTTKREPSPRRPFVKAASIPRNPSPDKRVETPLRSATTDNSTPRSSTRGVRSRPGSALSTPGTSTPGSVRARTVAPSPRLAGHGTPTEKDGHTRGPARVHALHSREATTLSPLSQDPIVPISNSIDDVTIKNPSSMFFHADEARIQDHAASAQAPTKKSTGFFYANGQREDQPPARLLRSVSPAMSMFAEKRPLSTMAPRTGTSELGLSSRPPITSPTLSAISSARSPFVTSPTALSPPLLSPLPSKTDYLNTPSATINHNKLRSERTYFEPSTPTTTMTDGLGVTMDPAAFSAISQSPRSHVKSSSVSVAPAESPSSARKRSATWAENKFESSPLAFKLAPNHTNNIPSMTSPVLPRADTASSLTSPIISDPMQSPSKELFDYAADARRERKVLDLEISNSSLLAINRSLEREIKKHKAELKRYRRLSRAGRFSVAPAGLEDEDFDDALPHVDGGLVGRPSSPFQEDVSDMELSEEEDTSEEEELTSSDLRMTKEAKQRAKDEAQLKNDLRKHRDLLLDTARMNRSLQRCLTWTEDLIKDGKKALVHQVQSSEVKLGGRVLEADEEEEGDLLEDDGGVVNEDEAAEDGIENDLSGIEAFLGMGQWPGDPSGRMSIGSEGTNRDSGVEMDKTARQQSPQTTTRVY